MSTNFNVTGTPVIDVTLAVKMQSVGVGTKFTLFTDRIVGIYDSPNMGCVVVCSGGTTIPIKESKQDVMNLMLPQSEAAQTTQEGKKDGSTATEQ